MPYTKQEDRDKYEAWVSALIEDLKEEGFPPGDVTYLMYKIVGHWFLHKRSYQTIAEVRGVLAGVLSEFDRKFAFPYEDEKIEENGDIDWWMTPREEPVPTCTGSDCNCEHELDTRGGA